MSDQRLTEAQEQAQAALDRVMNCRFSNFDAGAVIHWAERGMYQLKAPASFSPTPASDIAALREAGERLVKACDAFDSDELHTDDSVCAYSDALEDFRSALQQVAKGDGE